MVCVWLCTGEWKHDGREGHGTCWFADGSRYQGTWRDDRRHGEGEHRSSLGTRYHGDWRHDQREGHGIEEYTDGSRYGLEHTLRLASIARAEGSW